MKKEEHHLQVILCQYLDWNGYDFFSIPNGGLRHPRVGRALNAEGLRAGAADLFIVLANNTHHGLFIEVKTEKGVVSKEQKEWIKELNKRGYFATYVKGFEAAQKIIDDYFKGAI